MNGLTIRDLEVKYEKFTLNLSAEIKGGCITGLIGRNGAGKTTLIKSLMRQEDAAAGKILYGGKPFKGNEAEVLSKIACVFDVPHYNVYLKPRRIMKAFASIYPRFDAELFSRLMERFSLPADVRVAKYSFGMQRKFSLILALAQRPEILILDEPTSGIDPIDRAAVVDLVQEFMLDEGHTVLFSTHITEDLDNVADYIIILDGGRVKLCGEKDAIVQKYRLVQCPSLTAELEKIAIGPRRTMFGTTFLAETSACDNINGEGIGDGVIARAPTLEELFVHLVGEETK